MASGVDLDEIEELMKQEATRVRDDARALGIFADEYEYEYGCSEGKDLGFEDEEKAPDVAEQPAQPNETKAPSVAAVIFGALGVACSVISIALRSDRELGDGGERERRGAVDAR